MNAVVAPVVAIVAMLMLPLAQIEAAANDFKVMKLEQDVRKLEQEVRELSRQIAELRRGAVLSAEQIPATQEREAAAPQTPPLWLQAKNWQRVRMGMSEIEVIQTLGRPTSMRVGADGTTRVLLYALEIDTASFLSGSIEMRDRRVVQINIPVLK